MAGYRFGYISCRFSSRFAAIALVWLVCGVTTVGCAGQTWHVGEDGLTVTNARTSEQYVSAGLTAEGVAPMGKVQADAERRNTKGSWSDYMRELKRELLRAARRAKAAGEGRGSDSRTGDVIRNAREAGVLD